jgi:hypothetical protein
MSSVNAAHASSSTSSTRSRISPSRNFPPSIRYRNRAVSWTATGTPRHGETRSTSCFGIVIWPRSPAFSSTLSR